MQATAIPGRLKDLRFLLVESRSKRPIEPDWPGKANYAIDDAKLQAHLQAGGNYGVLCGYSNLLVIDADSPSVRDAVEALLPETFTAMTGRRGTHYYYDTDTQPTKPLVDPRNPDTRTNNVGHLKGRGGQVVGPGSVHENGNSYTVLKDLPIAHINIEYVLFALREFTGVEKTGKDLRTAESFDSPALKDATVDGVMANYASVHGLPNGFKPVGDGYIGPHPVHGSDGGQNFHLNTLSNYWYCFRCATGGGPLSLIALLEGVLSCEDCKSGGLRGDKFKTALALAKERYGFETTPRATGTTAPSSNSPGVSTGTSPDPHEIALSLMDKAKYVTDIETDEMYAYDRGIYRPVGENVVMDRVVAEVADCTEHFAGQVCFHIRSRTHHERDDFNPDIDVVPVLNGLYRISTGTLEPFDESRIYTYQLPVNYVAGADCPRIKKFIGEIVRSKDGTLLQEMVGYCLLRNYQFQKAFMLTGAGANGKGVLLHLLTRFLGPENVSAISLQDIANDRFTVVELRGKLANIHSDLSSKAVGDLGLFKMATGEDTIDGAVKFLQRKVRFLNIAKMIFSANRVPEIKEDSDAVYRRWLVVDFPNTFYGPRRDVNLLSKLLDPGELSGFLNWAVEGLKRLLAKGDFSHSPGTDEVRQQYQRMASPLRAFVDDCILVDPGSWISKEDLFARFMEYCDAHGLPKPSKTLIGREFPRYAPTAQDERRQVGNRGRERGWLGVKYRKEEEDESTEKPDGDRPRASIESWNEPAN